MEEHQNESTNNESPMDLKDEIIKTMDEKLDIEAVAQMVEHQEFSTRLNQSLQQRFNEIFLLLQQKDQLITSLQNRLENLELDIALLKRVIVPSVTVVPQMIKQNSIDESKSTHLSASGTQTHPDSTTTTENRTDSDEKISPPDFSKLRAMMVEEPKNKFVPPKTNEDKV